MTVPEQLTFLATIYQNLAQGESRRDEPTNDIEKALNKLEGMILIKLNQLEQP